MRKEKDEIWKDIIGYEGLYEISNLGRVKSLFRIIKRSNGKIQTIQEKILKSGLNKRGYLSIVLSKEGKNKSKKVHQLVTESFLNHSPCGCTLVVNHINFNRTDNKVENLEIITQRENSNQKHLKSSSIYTGVTWCKYGKKWKSSIVINGKNKHLGMFNDEKKASEYYQNALFAHLNNLPIKVKKYISSSKYKGVTFSKSCNKWQAYIRVNKKQKTIGYFKNEIDAFNAVIIAQKEHEILANK